MINNENAAQTDQMLDNNEDDTKPPKDRYYMSYLLFYALGTTSALASHFFLTANDYWMYKFRDINAGNYTSENRTGLQAQFTTTYNAVSSVCNVVFLITTIVLSGKIGVLKRLIGALCVMLVIFGITVIFVVARTDSWQSVFFVITMITGGILGSSSSVFMISVFHLVSKFPEHYLSPILAGQSICGIFSALVEIFSISIGANSITNGLVYFLTGLTFLFFTFVFLILTLFRSEFFYYYLTKPDENVERPKVTKDACKSVFNKIKYYLFSMVIVLGCTILMNPGVTALVQSTSKGNGNKWNDLYFVPVVTFLGFNLFDWIGREASGHLSKPSKSVIVFVVSVLRIIFVPLLLFCNAQPRHHLGVAFGDAPYIIFIIIFAFSNGYIVNLCVLMMPLVTKPEEKMISMAVIIVCMVLPLVACSLISSAIVSAL